MYPKKGDLVKLRDDPGIWTVTQTHYNRPTARHPPLVTLRKGTSIRIEPPDDLEIIES